MMMKGLGHPGAHSGTNTHGYGRDSVLVTFHLLLSTWLSTSFFYLILIFFFLQILSMCFSWVSKGIGLFIYFFVIRENSQLFFIFPFLVSPQMSLFINKHPLQWAGGSVTAEWGKKWRWTTGKNKQSHRSGCWYRTNTISTEKLKRIFQNRWLNRERMREKVCSLSPDHLYVEMGKSIKHRWTFYGEKKVLYTSDWSLFR